MTSDEKPMAMRKPVSENVMSVFGESLRLLQNEGNEDAIRFLEHALRTHTDEGCRRMAMSLLHSHLGAAERHADCLNSSKAFVAEFPDDAMAWSQLAGDHFHAMHRPNYVRTAEDAAEALRCYRRAFALARTDDSMVRYIGFSYCRALTELGHWQQLEEIMRTLVEDFSNSERAEDIPRIEGDWIEHIPDGVVDPGVVKAYVAAMGG